MPQQQGQPGLQFQNLLFDPSMSLAVALGEVLKNYSERIVHESEVNAQMSRHPQGDRWRSCLEVMVEQSVRHGSLHPECPEIRLSVHTASTNGPDGAPSLIIMVSHPVAAPFKFYCEASFHPCQLNHLIESPVLQAEYPYVSEYPDPVACAHTTGDANRQYGNRQQVQMQDIWLKLSAKEKRPYEEQAATMRGLSLSAGMAAQASSVGLIMAGSGLQPAPHSVGKDAGRDTGQLGQKEQHQQLQQQQQRAFLMDRQLMGGAGGENVSMAPSTEHAALLPRPWCTDQQLQQQQQAQQATKQNLSDADRFHQDQLRADLQGTPTSESHMLSLQGEMSLVASGRIH
jgi:hypothetical protein